jgi:hypothetical protein
MLLSPLLDEMVRSARMPQRAVRHLDGERRAAVYPTPDHSRARLAPLATARRTSVMGGASYAEGGQLNRQLRFIDNGRHSFGWP